MGMSAGGHQGRGSRRGRRGGRRQLVSEINVTPFVDVMLVLLVIFMVTAPLLYQGVDVNLPETNTQPLRMQNEPLVRRVGRKIKLAQEAIEHCQACLQVTVG